MSETEREILMFQVGPRVFAAEVQDVVRIGGSVRSDAPGVGSALGEPFERRRGIVVACGAGAERTLAVDHVIGVRSVPRDDVHPLPPLAAHCLGSGAVVGFALLDEIPTLLIDLPTLLREQLSGPAAGPERKEHHHA